MFQVRGIIIVDRPKLTSILTRTFPTAWEGYFPKLSKTFVKSFIKCTTVEKECSTINDRESYSIDEVEGLYPVVSTTVGDISYVAIMKQRKRKKQETLFKNDLRDMLEDKENSPEVTMVFTLLEDLSDRYFKLNKALQGNTVINYLHMYVSQSMPFGRPLDTCPDTIHSVLTKKFSSSEVVKKKQVAWRPHHGAENIKKQKIIFTIQEQVTSYQVEKEELANEATGKFRINGTVSCSCFLKGNPNLNLRVEGKYIHNLTASNSSWIPPEGLGHLKGPYLSEISPKMGQFVVCKYEGDHNSTTPPIRAIFQMKRTNALNLKFLLQVKIENIKWQVEYCDVSFPFQRKIKSYKFDTHYGMMVLSGDRKSLTWKMVKFTKQEMALKGSVVFMEKNEGKDDPFLNIGNNMHLAMRYKILGETLTKAKVSDVSLSNSSKIHNLVVNKEVVAHNIVVWNSLSDVRYTKNPKL